RGDRSNIVGRDQVKAIGMVVGGGDEAAHGKPAQGRAFREERQGGDQLTIVVAGEKDTKGRTGRKVGNPGPKKLVTVEYVVACGRDQSVPLSFEASELVRHADL